MQNKDKFVKNRYGVAISKCCASCLYKKMDGSNRLCTNGMGIVPPSWSCDNWQMAAHLNDVGRGSGSVKKCEYLQFYLDSVDADYEREAEALKRGEAYTRKTVSEIREEFKEKHGTIYLME